MTNYRSERIHTNGWNGPLDQGQLDLIRQCFRDGLSASKAAKIACCSTDTACKYYKLLRAGQAPQIKHRKPSGPKPGWGKGPRPKKPLVNESRFYHSNFEPV